MKIQRKESKVYPERAFIPVLKKRSGRNQRAKSVSSLLLAYQLTRRVSGLGFDWPDLKGVLKKMEIFPSVESRRNGSAMGRSQKEEERCLNHLDIRP
jgi:hypothetical protein